VPKSDPLKRLRSFIVGEGSQLAPGPATARVERSLRFVVTLGQGPDGPDVFVSVFSPKQPHGIEVMAWDMGTGGFNYYRSAGAVAMWMFAGNSRDALHESTQRRGPFAACLRLGSTLTQRSSKERAGGEDLAANSSPP
jgi:hypothetical protein